MKCEAAAAILASEGPAPVSVGRQYAGSSCDFAQHVSVRVCVTWHKTQCVHIDPNGVISSETTSGGETGACLRAFYCGTFFL